MTFLPASFRLAPEMAEIGISVAGVATAESDADIARALIGLRGPIARLRDVFGAAYSREQLRTDLRNATEAELRDLLVAIGTNDENFAELMAIMTKWFAPRLQRFVAHKLDSEAIADIQCFLEEARRVYMPLCRESHLLLIAEIFHRAAQAGINEAELPDDWIESTMVEPAQEIGRWHETAYLMCDSNRLPALVAAGQLDARDVSHEYERLAAADKRQA